MAEKKFQTRIQLKYDTLANWTTNATSFVPKRGEVCIIEIPSTGTGIPNSESVAPPQYLMKVGDGSTTFPNLAYTSGLAADVYAWAKKSVWEYDDAFSSTSTDGMKYTNYTKLKAAIEALSANYEYQLTPSGTTLLLQKRIEGSSDTWTTVSTINTDGTYNATTNVIATQSTVSSAIDSISGAGIDVTSAGVLSATTQATSDDSTNVATTAFVHDMVETLDSTVDVTATTPASSVVPTTTPTADFKVLTKVNEVDGKLVSTSSAAVNVKKLAATGAAKDMTVTSATYGGQTATTNAQTALDNLASAIQSAVSGSVTSIGGKQGIVTLGNGLEAGGTNENFIRVNLAESDGSLTRNTSGEDYLAFDTNGGLTVDHVDSSYTTTNTTDLATVNTVKTAVEGLDSTQDLVVAGSYTPTGSEKATYKYDIYEVKETDGKVTSTGATVTDTLYLSEAPSATNPIITLNDIGAIAGAMVYKGTVNSNSDLPTASTTGVQPGWTYVVATAGTYDGVACEVGDMIIVKTVTAGTSITFNIVNGENQVTNNNANITVGAASGSETALATVDGVEIKARVSVTAGSATIASQTGNVVTIKTGVTQTGTSGTIANASGTDIVLDDVAVTGAANELTVTSGTYGGATATTNAQTALNNLATAATATDDLSTSTVTANKSIGVSSTKSTTTVTFKGTDFTGLTLVDDSDTSKTDVVFTQASNVVTAEVKAMNVNNLYQSTSDVLVLYGGTSTDLI